MKNIEKFINKYSCVFNTVKNGNTIIIKGILQPFHNHYKTYFTPKRFPAGVYDGRHYLLITTPDYGEKLKRSIVINNGEMSYFIKSVDTYRIKDKDLYVWAVLSAHTENIGDDYEQHN